MEHIGLLPFRFNPRPLLDQLERHPQVWNQIRMRTSHPRSPHREVSDIWVRYNALDNLVEGMSIDAFNGPHESMWYPVLEHLPAAKELAENLGQKLGATALGGILITRLSPGCQVYPHIDRGWHAETYEKAAIQLKGCADQAFCFQDGELSAEDGESYWFHNTVPHWVRNDSDRERITLIVTFRRAH